VVTRAKGRTGGRRWAAIGGLLLTGLAFASPAAAKPAPTSRAYNVKVYFTQTRSWSYYHQQVGEECTSTEDGSGSDDARFISAKALFALESSHHGVAGFGVKVDHARTGTKTHTFSGDPGVCASNYSDPTTGCGTKQSLVAFPTLTINRTGTTDEIPGYVPSPNVILLEFDWDSTASVPEFNPCPFFAGSNEAQEGQELPGDAYLDLPVPVDRKKFLAAKHNQVWTGYREIIGSESCGNIVYGCPEGVTYNATATVRAEAKFVFTPKR
jgi:hypothetical protein